MGAHTTACARAGIWLVALLALVGAAAPAAAVVDDGLWYVTRTGVAEAHQAGITGEGITVAVIDSRINADIPEFAGTGLILEDTIGCTFDLGLDTPPPTATATDASHGTDMAAHIIGNGTGVGGQPGIRGVAPDVELLYYATSHGTTNLGGCTLNGKRAVPEAMKRAVDDGAQIISISLDVGFVDDALEALTYALRNDVIVVLPSPQGSPWSEGIMQSGNGVVTVESFGPDGQRSASAHAHHLLTAVAPGIGIRAVSADSWDEYEIVRGSSYSTAWTAGALALAWSAHPDATGNQLIQALLRTTEHNTTAELDRLSDDDGYGVISVPQLLQIDPTTLPDENPLLRQDDTAQPAYTDIIPTATPEPTEPGPEPATTTADPPPESLTSPLSGALTTVLISAIGLILLIAITVATILTTRRRAPHPHHLPPPEED